MLLFHLDYIFLTGLEAVDAGKKYGCVLLRCMPVVRCCFSSPRLTICSPRCAPRGSVPFIISFESFIWSLIGISSLDSWHSRWKTSLIQREAFNRWSRSHYSPSHGFQPCQNSRTTSGMSFLIFLMASLISYHLEECCGFLNCWHFYFFVMNVANFPMETVCSYSPSYVERFSASSFSGGLLTAEMMQLYAVFMTASFLIGWAKPLLISQYLAEAVPYIKLGSVRNLL